MEEEGFTEDVTINLDTVWQTKQDSTIMSTSLTTFYEGTNSAIEDPSTSNPGEGNN